MSVCIWCVMCEVCACVQEWVGFSVPGSENCTCRGPRWGVMCGQLGMSGVEGAEVVKR